jgi:hypothetical protein
MPEIALALVFMAAIVALSDWRKGFVLCALTAILQDPLRKLTPGEPAYFVLLVGVVFAAAVTGALMRRKRLTPGIIQGWKPFMGKPFSLFLVLVAIQAAHSLARFGSPMMTGIGLLAYLAPVPALVLAYHFALRTGLAGIRGWMTFYVLAAMVSLSGVYLEYLGFDWKALGEVGEGLTIYDVGTVLQAYSGFFRSSEIAAWHTAAIGCLLFILLIGRRINPPRIVLVGAAFALLVSLGILTGRRKMLVEMAVFVSAYFCLVAWFQYRATRPAVVAAVAGVLAYAFIVGALRPDGAESSTKSIRIDPSQKYEHYAVRGKSAFGDAPERFEALGLQPVMWAVNSFGFFGAGLGTGSQGVQHVAGAAQINRGAAEGGLGKFTMELGVPGLLLMVWLAIAFGRYIRRLLIVTTKISIKHARIAYGLTAFLIANAATFSIATQAYGDLFVLLVMGWTAGFLLAMPVLASRSVDAERQGSRQQQPPAPHRKIQPHFAQPQAR